MIGDSADFNDCSKKEIQIPKAWSGSSITFTVNQGTFREGDLVYLFVVDQDGNTGNGFPITIGSNGAVLPSSPTNLRIIEQIL
jgi:hypothetical protein